MENLLINTVTHMRRQGCRFIACFLIAFPLVAAAQLNSAHQSAATIIKAAERNGIKFGSDDWYLLLAIRKAENGKSGREWGIMNPKANTEELQAAWCACTIRNEHKRSGIDEVNDTYIESLAKRYCPVGAKNDPKRLNKNWIKNVKYWYRKLRIEK
jgi:hypothetical protein